MYGKKGKLEGLYRASLILIKLALAKIYFQTSTQHSLRLFKKFLVFQSGLDILCEYTDPNHITKAMGVLKRKPSSMVIFYLKLRHNNTPKLQGFVFLGLEISHLTIHNSSLAVVEESSLSSIGK